VTLNPPPLSLQGFIIRITENVDAIIYIPAASGPWGEKIREGKTTETWHTVARNKTVPGN
jgi:hypothetical protein